MTSLFDLNENSSDSEDDVDYVPDGNVSDVSVSGEDASNDDDLPEESKTKRKSRQKKKNTSPELEKESDNGAPEVSKAKADDIWKSFLEEVDETPLNKSEKSSSVSPPIISSSAENSTKNESTSNSVSSNSKKNNISEVLEFAGETIAISEDGSVLNNVDSDGTVLKESNLPTNSSASNISNTSVKRKGLQSVLGTIMNKKQKINTLQKSLIDWKSFKKDEGIEEELQTFNRGKGGFVERQRFLERSNVRSFEIERDVRLSKAKK